MRHLSRPLLLLIFLTMPVIGWGKNPPATLPHVFGKTDAATLLPELKDKQLLDQWRNDRYGLVVLTSGEIALVYRPGGEKLFSATSWYLQGQMIDPNGKTVFSYLGMGGNFNGDIDIKATPEGHRLYEIKGATGRHFTWNRRIICKPGALRIEMEFTITAPLPEGTTPNLFSNLKILAKPERDFAEPNANPINILTRSSSFDIHYDASYRWHSGYHIKGDTVIFQPIHNQPFEVGKTYRLVYEVEL